jgi:thiamine-monophosphate kinase
VERIAAALRVAFPQRSGEPLDDAAVIEGNFSSLLLCVDAAVEGVHVDVGRFPAGDLGFRATVAALSDLAAMGGRALGVVVAICARADADVMELEAGAIEACVASGCAVVGGNLSVAPTTSVAVSALGEAPPGGAVRRGGARAGDALFVTGPLGGSAAGLRRRRDGAALDDRLVAVHRRPVPRLHEGALAARSGATAMIDVSDGLARDARRLAAAGEVGLELRDVPVAEGATLDDALGGGEDYELVIAHREPALLLAAFADAGLRSPIAIGVVHGDPGVARLDGSELVDVGWRHGAPGAQEPR